MRILLTLIFLFSCSSLYAAESRKEGHVEWKAFESNLGFGFKYPDCFKLSIGEVYFSGKSIKNSGSVSAQVTRKCQNKALDSTGIVFTFWKEARKDEYEKEKLQRKSDISTLIFVNQGINGVEGFLYLEKINKKIRWRGESLCASNKRLSLRGPKLEDTNPLYKKAVSNAKRGSLYIPEPYKTLIESAHEILNSHSCVLFVSRIFQNKSAAFRNAARTGQLFKL